MTLRLKISLFISLGFLLILSTYNSPAHGQETVITPPHHIMLDSGEYGQFPHFRVSPTRDSKQAQMIRLGGWDVGDSYSKVGIKRVRDTIDAVYSSGYNIVYIRVDWKAVEPIEKDMILGQLGRLTELLDDIERRNMKLSTKSKVKAIVAFELDEVPGWFRNKHPGSIMMQVNPYTEISGPMGPVRNVNEYSTWLNYGILNEPNYHDAIRAVINHVVIQLRNHPALFGWALTTPSSPMMYPGAGKKSLGGFADYSPYSMGKFADLYQVDDDYYPLARSSEGSPDLRPSWRAWCRYRIQMRREAVDALGRQIYNLDYNHPIFVLFWGVMAYKGDNGYRSEVWANDYYYQLTQDYVNGVIIPFMLSSKTFNYPSGETDMDSLHQLTKSVEMAQRYNKVPLLIVEKSPKYPPSHRDITDLAHLAVVLGVDIIWSHNSMSHLSPPWTTIEKEVIEKTSHLNLLPLPDKKQRARIAVLDYPFELSKFYSEKDDELSNSMVLLDALQDAGYNYTVITPDELNASDELPEPEDFAVYPVMSQSEKWMNDIEFVSPLAANMSEYWPERVTQFFDRVKDMDKKPHIFSKTMIDSFLYNEYDDKSVREQLHNEFRGKGVQCHWKTSNKCFIVVNWPYIFMKVAHRETNDMKINLEQFDEHGALLTGTGTLTFYDMYNDPDFSEILKYSQMSGELDFIFPRRWADTYLLVWSPKVTDIADSIIEHRSLIEQQHRMAAMRRSLPIALILTFVAIALGVIYTIQLYHPTVVKKRKKRRRPPPILHDHEDYFKLDD